MTMEKLREELDRAVQVPGLTNLWVPPIRNRIDMLATGIKSPIGIKISGPDTEVLETLAESAAQIAEQVPGVSSAVAERVAGGRYVDVRIRRDAAARSGFTQSQVQALIATVVGGDPISETIEGRERYPIVLRFPRDQRDSLARLSALSLVSASGEQLTLGSIADIAVVAGPPMLKSDNGRLVSYVYVDVAGRDLGSVVADLQRVMSEKLQLPAGYAVGWSGQYEFLQRALERLRWVVPATLGIIFVLIYLVFRSAAEAAIIMLSLPLALVGGLWLIWVMSHAVSIASVIGFIALAGVAAEFGIIMLLYLRQAWQRQLEQNPESGAESLDDAIREGAVLRVRPKAMTVAVILAGLLPILLGGGAGAEVMQRIAAPMVGGMITAPLLSMLVIPAAYRLLKRRSLSGPAR